MKIKLYFLTVTNEFGYQDFLKFLNDFQKSSEDPEEYVGTLVRYGSRSPGRHTVCRKLPARRERCEGCSGSNSTSGTSLSPGEDSHLRGVRARECMLQFVPVPIPVGGVCKFSYRPSRNWYNSIIHNPISADK